LTMTQVIELVGRLRKRFTEYRFENRYEKDIVHVNAVEIVVCLCEYMIEKKRAIRDCEKTWFEAGWYMVQIFEGTKNEDIGLMYGELVEIVKNKSFFISDTAAEK